MKDYKRLTKRNADGSACYALPLTSSFIGAIYEEQKERDGEILRLLAELEDKIESGELCEREEVRKETAREILKSMLNKMYKLTGCGVPYHVKKFIEEIAVEYGVELFGNSDKLEDEE